ncbi:MAG: multidrug transporter ATP-binding protein [Herbinix sp.]|jgi:ABC-2 type transport system ATP-binding protein|nr:multidrug transporter ATP-binding protein [Herbinix sp.]
MSAIEVEHLCRDFEYYEKESGIRGSVKNLFHREKNIRHAVKDVSFDIKEGEVVGFLGPNGAGKTTTIKMLSGILHPTSGVVRVNGFIPWERKNDYKRQFSFVAGQKSQLWNDLPASESFHLNQCIYEIPDTQYNNTLEELVELFGVKDFLKVQVRRLSLGERMKMEMIAALLHKPKILFLDEPTIGLDVVAQTNIRAFLKKYNKANKTTILLTSHYMRDIEELCDRSIIINHGSLVYDGELSTICNQLSNRRVINLSFYQVIPKHILEPFGSVTEYQENKASLEVENDKLTFVSQKLLNELPIADLSIEPISIERGIASLFSGKEV